MSKQPSFFRWRKPKQRPDAAPPNDHDEFVETRHNGLKYMKQRLTASPSSDAAPVALRQNVINAMDCLSAFIPHPHNLTECIKACVRAQSSRQTRIHAAWWELKAGLDAHPEDAPGGPWETIAWWICKGCAQSWGGGLGDDDFTQCPRCGCTSINRLKGDAPTEGEKDG